MFQDGKDQLLLRHQIKVRNPVFASHLQQLRVPQLLQLGEVQLGAVAAGGNSDALSDLGRFADDLFGQRQRISLRIEFADAPIDDLVRMSLLALPAVAGIIT